MASPTGSGQQQTKYKSETPSHELKFANKASRIFRAAPAFRVVGASWNPSFPPRSRHKVSANQRVAESRAHAASFVPEAVRRQAMVAKAFRPSAARAPIRDGAKEAGTNGAGIGDAPRRAIRGAKGNPNSLRRRAAVRPWSPKRSVPRRLGAPIRDGAKEPSTNGAGIGDATRRAIRGEKGNPNSRRRRAAVRSWSPKRSVPRRLGCPDPGRGEGSGHKRSRNQRRGAPRDSWRERQSQFAPPRRRRSGDSQSDADKSRQLTASRLKGRCQPPRDHSPDHNPGARRMIQLAALALHRPSRRQASRDSLKREAAWELSRRSMSL